MVEVVRSSKMLIPTHKPTRNTGYVGQEGQYLKADAEGTGQRDHSVALVQQQHKTHDNRQQTKEVRRDPAPSDRAFHNVIFFDTSFKIQFWHMSEKKKI